VGGSLRQIGERDWKNSGHFKLPDGLCWNKGKRYREIESERERERARERERKSSTRLHSLSQQLGEQV